MVDRIIMMMQNFSFKNLKTEKIITQKDYRIYYILYVDNRRFIPLEIYNSLKSNNCDE